MQAKYIPYWLLDWWGQVLFRATLVDSHQCQGQNFTIVYKGLIKVCVKGQLTSKFHTNLIKGNKNTTLQTLTKSIIFDVFKESYFWYQPLELSEICSADGP